MIYCIIFLNHIGQINIIHMFFYYDTKFNFSIYEIKASCTVVNISKGERKHDSKLYFDFSNRILDFSITQFKYLLQLNQGIINFRF